MLDVDKTETANKAADTPELSKASSVAAAEGNIEKHTATKSGDEELKNDVDDDDLDESQAAPVQRKLPAWAIWVAVIAFVVFNAFFLVFAMQMGSGSPSD